MFDLISIFYLASISIYLYSICDDLLVDDPYRPLVALLSNDVVAIMALSQEKEFLAVSLKIVKFSEFWTEFFGRDFYLVVGWDLGLQPSLGFAFQFRPNFEAQVELELFHLILVLKKWL